LAVVEATPAPESDPESAVESDADPEAAPEAAPVPGLVAVGPPSG
jgi:hypothetical protein